MRRLLYLIPALALALTGCIETANGAPPTAAQAISAVASAGASVADAVNVAPPSTFTTQAARDEAAIKLSEAFTAFNSALGVIDALNLVKNSPMALAVRKGEIAVQTALNAAQAALTAADATKWADAVASAKAGLNDITTALQKK